MTNNILTCKCSYYPSGECLNAWLAYVGNFFYKNVPEMEKKTLYIFSLSSSALIDSPEMQYITHIHIHAFNCNESAYVHAYTFCVLLSRNDKK